jgi:hypothetical protein
MVRLALKCTSLNKHLFNLLGLGADFQHYRCLPIPNQQLIPLQIKVTHIHPGVKQVYFFLLVFIVIIHLQTSVRRL